MSPQEGHKTVLLHEAVDFLDIQATDTVVDATLGGAGHAREITKRLDAAGVFIGFDLDADAIARAEVSLKGIAPRSILINANFRYIEKELQARGIDRIQKALFDLGWSGYQLAAGRGFSFLTDEPLLMTYAKSGAPFSAATIVNEWEESSIADVLFGWGEERYARRIAKAIVEYRAHTPIETSAQLAEIVRSAVPGVYRRGKLHPATKTFQALRIAVNDEIGALEEGLRGALRMLASGGRVAVITFHSIEDRAVKRLFAGWEKEGLGKRITKKPLAPSFEEIRDNPRARSAKLRVFEHF